MGRACTICTHEQRADIEKGLELSRPTGVLSREFHVSQSAINRHRAHIVPKSSVGAHETTNPTEIVRLKAEANRILSQSKDDKVRLLALQRLQGLAELEARLAQEASGASALEADPAFQRLAAALARTLCAACLRAVDDLSDGCLTVAAAEVAAAPTPGDTRSE